MDTEKYFDYILSETQKILAIDSPVLPEMLPTMYSPLTARSAMSRYRR